MEPYFVHSSPARAAAPWGQPTKVGLGGRYTRSLDRLETTRWRAHLLVDTRIAWRTTESQSLDAKFPYLTAPTT